MSKLEKISNNKLFIVLGVIFAIYIISDIILISKQEIVVATINYKEMASFGSGDNLYHKYLIYTNDETFENTDSILLWKFNSLDIQGKLKQFHQYELEVCDISIPFTSTHRNIISAKEIHKK